MRPAARLTLFDTVQLAPVPHGRRISVISRFAALGPRLRMIQGATLSAARLACYKYTQFGLRDGKFRDATIQTYQNLRKDPNGRLINIFQAGKMDGHLC